MRLTHLEYFLGNETTKGSNHWRKITSGTIGEQLDQLLIQLGLNT